MAQHGRKAIIIIHDNEKQFKSIGLSRTGKILKSKAEEDDLYVTNIYRLPTFDKKRCEEQWLKVIETYNTVPGIKKIYIDNLNDFSELSSEFTSILITHLVDIISNKGLKIYNLENELTIDKHSTKEQWFPILQHKHSKKVEDVAICNEFDGTDIDIMDKRINWDVDVFFINSVRISDEFKDLFNYSQKWSRRVHFDYGKIENVIAFFRVRHPNIKLYKAKESTLRAWNFVLSMFDMETTKLVLEKKYGCEFNIKRTSK